MSRSKKPPYHVVESRSLYNGHIIQLVKDRFILRVAPKKIVTRELVKHPGAVAIVPFVNKEAVVLLRQFRYAAQGDLWEIPAGTLEDGEQPLECAKRELGEETGFKAKRWKYLTRFYSAPGISDEVMTLFRADALVKGKKDLDHDEWIEPKIVSLKSALQMVRNGSIRDAKSIAGLLWVSQF